MPQPLEGKTASIEDCSSALQIQYIKDSKKTRHASLLAFFMIVCPECKFPSQTKKVVDLNKKMTKCSKLQP